MSDEHGKVISDARGEVQRGLEVVEFACGIPQLLKGEYSDQVSTGIDMFSYRQALGVVCGITPFNFPVMVPMLDAPDRHRLRERFRLEAERAGPLGLHAGRRALGRGRAARWSVQRGERGQGGRRCLARPPGRGRRFLRRFHPYRPLRLLPGDGNWEAAQALGGAKNHAVVLPDADLDFAADHVVAAAFGSAGERCMAISAAVAVGDAGDALVGVLRDKGAGIRVGPGRDEQSEMGPVITQEAKNRILGYIDRSEQAGAHLALDGRGIQVAGHENGFFVGPTIIDQVTPAMEVYRDEIFGPSFPWSGRRRPTRRWPLSTPTRTATAPRSSRRQGRRPAGSTEE